MYQNQATRVRFTTVTKTTVAWALIETAAMIRKTKMSSSIKTRSWKATHGEAERQKKHTYTEGEREGGGEKKRGKDDSEWTRYE